MDGKGDSFVISIPELQKVEQTQTKPSNKSFYLKEWTLNVWKFCREDINRVIFPLKVGLAILLVSLLILYQATYEEFGTDIFWSTFTVSVMFEYTVGATFNQGANLAVGSLLAGVLAVAVLHVAVYSGDVVEPTIIGASIFIIGALTSFMKLWPSLSQYDFGFRVILFSYCLIIVSAYRMENPIRTSLKRLYSVGIGAFVTISVNMLVFPIWDGEQLHNELVKNFESVADSLEECIRNYLEKGGPDHSELLKTAMDEFPDEPAYRRFHETLNSSSKLEALASLAKWEPPHRKFWRFSYPWSEYVKVGAVLRYCGYEVMALHGVLHSEIQMRCNHQIAFKQEIVAVTNHAAELVRSLGKDISNMKLTAKFTTLMEVHVSTESLQQAIAMHYYLLASNPEDFSDSSKPLTGLSDPPSSIQSDKPLTKQFHTLSPVLSENSYSLIQESENLEPSINPVNQHLDTVPAETESYHKIMKKQKKRIHSWPSRELNGFDDGRLEMDNLPRMKTLDSTAELTLRTFTSLLIEFVARLDHLVESVNKLAEMAKFQNDVITRKIQYKTSSIKERE